MKHPWIVVLMIAATALAFLYVSRLQYVAFGAAGAKRLEERAIQRSEPWICGRIVVIEKLLGTVPIPMPITTTGHARSECYTYYVSVHRGQDVCPADNWTCVETYAELNNKPDLCLTLPEQQSGGSERPHASMCLLSIANRFHAVTSCDYLDRYSEPDAAFCRTHYAPY